MTSPLPYRLRRTLAAMASSTPGGRFANSGTVVRARAVGSVCTPSCSLEPVITGVYCGLTLHCPAPARPQARRRPVSEPEHVVVSGYLGARLRRTLQRFARLAVSGWDGVGLQPVQPFGDGIAP